MKIIEKGHIYELEYLDGEENEVGLLTFVNRELGTEHSGTQTQEVLRALIDRTQHCDSCLPWEGNKKIIYHLRMALILHEMRALERQVEKGILRPELEPVGNNGHFLLNYNTTKIK